MKRYFGIVYWVAAVFFTSLLFMNLVDGYFAALFLAVILLPGVLFAKFLERSVSYANRRRAILEIVYLLSVVLLTEYLFLFLIYRYLIDFNLGGTFGILFNPFFLWFLIVAFLALEKVLISRIKIETSYSRFTEFTSERRKIKIETDTILYVESRDDVVFVVTSSGEQYRTKMNITLWSNVLDDRFVRVHRAFIVNRSHIRSFSAGQLSLSGGATVDVSKKYRDHLSVLLEKLSV